MKKVPWSQKNFESTSHKTRSKINIVMQMNGWRVMASVTVWRRRVMVMWWCQMADHCRCKLEQRVLRICCSTAKHPDTVLEMCIFTDM